MSVRLRIVCGQRVDSLLTQAVLQPPPRSADVPASREMSLEAQFSRVVTPLMRHLLNHARAILHSEDLAWDAVQESLVSLWATVKTGHAVPDHAGPWLCRAVIYRSLHIARTGSRRIKHEQLACAAKSRLSRHEDPSRVVEEGELREILALALTQIPETYRRVFELRELQGLEYAQIALELQIPMGTVRSRLKRGRGLLQQILEQAVCTPLEIAENEVGQPVANRAD